MRKLLILILFLFFSCNTVPNLERKKYSMVFVYSNCVEAFLFEEGLFEGTDRVIDQAKAEEQGFFTIIDDVLSRDRTNS